MTKTSTNKANPGCNDESLTEDLDYAGELDTKDQRFYTVISSHLNLIQLHPKEETVLKIITYSKNKSSI